MGWKEYIKLWVQKLGWMILSTKLHGIILATWMISESKIQGSDYMKILLAYFACNIGMKFMKFRKDKKDE